MASPPPPASASGAAKFEMPNVNVAPYVAPEADARQVRVFSGAKNVPYNLPASDMWAPAPGPQNPFLEYAYSRDRSAESAVPMPRDMTGGYHESAAVADFIFDEQYRNFYKEQRRQKALAEKGFEKGTEQLVAERKEAVVDAKKRKREFDKFLEQRKKEREEEIAAEVVAKEAEAAGAEAEVAGVGEEGLVVGPGKMVGPGAEAEDAEVVAEEEGPDKDGKGVTNVVVEDENPATLAAEERGLGPMAHVEESAVFHLRKKYDYQGRTFVDKPSGLKASSWRSGDAPYTYVPKRVVHIWTGHTKGVNAIRFFPGYGHLLLSASNDNTAKIWDVTGGNNMNCVQTYKGHAKAIRQIDFTPDGRRFFTASFDRYMKQWDTETGQCVGRYSNKRVPFCCVPYPENPHVVMCGCANKKIVQWDTRSGKIEQEYDQHLAAVNTVTFLDRNRRFVSSSDDKTLRVWEFGIPVTIKYIADPSMHSMPSTCLHPSGKFFLAQSMDNQIMIYDAKDRFRLNRKKQFRGHQNSGFAVQVSCSPDGKHVISGDAGGSIFFWEFQKPFNTKRLGGHTKVCIGCAWHPLETSKVATCSWDGTIKYWD